MLSDKHYVGAPCKYGHGNIRYKSNTHCIVCQRMRNDGHRKPKLDPEVKRERDRITNLAKIRAYKAARSNRLPAWADLSAIKAFYDNCPPGHVVDHIIPLRGKLVSGLHVHNNLQYLPIADNARKSNKFDPERDS